MTYEEKCLPCIEEQVNNEWTLNFPLLYRLNIPVDLKMQNALCWRMTVLQALRKSIAVPDISCICLREDSATLLFCLKFTAQNYNVIEQWAVEYPQAGCRHLIAGWLNSPSPHSGIQLYLPYVWLRNNLLDSRQMHFPNTYCMFHLKL